MPPPRAARRPRAARQPRAALPPDPDPRRHAAEKGAWKSKTASWPSWANMRDRHRDLANDLVWRLGPGGAGAGVAVSEASQAEAFLRALGEELPTWNVVGGGEAAGH